MKLINRTLTVLKLSRLTVSILIGLISIQPAMSAIEATQFKDQATEERYQTIISELRCLVCQNQNLADSDAGLAKDLRRKTAEMLQQGKSDGEIYDFMSDRYGEFVLYKPQFNAQTAALWLAPFILLLIAAIGLFINIRRRQTNTGSTISVLSESQRNKVRDILNSSDDLND